ncbi:MAG: DNA-deoxyinosine glycosylase [Chloroflexi bacterium]|nr:DNA-deoxyinosine glycosylase [Chloroflexota bacterium]
MGEMLRSFAPIVDDDATVLVLGSMPSVTSLARQQYYGHPRNQFWAILAAVFEEQVAEDYAARVAFLLCHRLALWDTLASCERVGSADDRIRQPAPNDVGTLLAAHPGILRILLNGQAAAGYYRRLIAPTVADVYEIIVLPSTSPLNTAPLEQKVAAWKRALLHR